jgi:hypothetical protein
LQTWGMAFRNQSKYRIVTVRWLPISIFVPYLHFAVYQYVFNVVYWRNYIFQ